MTGTQRKATSKASSTATATSRSRFVVQPTAANAAPDAAIKVAPDGNGCPGRQPTVRKVAKKAAISTSASAGPRAPLTTL